MKSHLPVLAVALCLTVGACKDKRPDTETKAKAVPARTGLDAVPASVRVVLGIDVQEVAGSWLVERAVQQMFLRDPGLEARVQRLVKACRLRPADDLYHLLIALGADDDVDEALLVATGVFSEPDVATCVEHSLTEDGGVLARVEVGGRRLYRADGRAGGGEVGDSLWFTFGDPTTLIAATSQEWLLQAVGDGPKVMGAKPMATWIERAEPEAGIWAAGVVDGRIGADLVEVSRDQISAPPVGMYGHLRLRHGLAFELAAVTASPADAKILAEQARAQIGIGALAMQRYGLGPVVSRLQVEAADEILYLRLELSKEELRDVLSRLDTAGAGGVGDGDGAGRDDGDSDGAGPEDQPDDGPDDEAESAAARPPKGAAASGSRTGAATGATP
ncbi:hypothetical protein [Haliangium sp.]|uniref:hypothetical protein n=1 Tax=Haliangium sp. TaxID=2663208 RepID=UPI003D09E3A5